MATTIIGLSTPPGSIFMSPSLPKGGCFIVDSTRKGKKFPDSMSKTIPIWTCVLNRAVRNYLNKFRESDLQGESNSSQHESVDCAYLHLPLWVSKAERGAIEDRLEEWTQQLEASGADIASLALCLKKPLRPLWISQKTVIWLNEVPDYDSWDFTPVILVSASSQCGIIQNRTTSEFSWNYIPGAGDDEESWARNLSPTLFWKNAQDLIESGPEACNQKVADIVERDRVYRAQRGQIAPQINIKSSKFVTTDHHSCVEQDTSLNSVEMKTDMMSPNVNSAVSWFGSTNVAVGTTQAVTNALDVDCILNCDVDSIDLCLEVGEAYLHLPILNSKFNRFSLLSNLPAAVNFAKANLVKDKKLLVCCRDGEDISICVCLAILTSLFNSQGAFDDGKSFADTCMTKLEMRRRLVYICNFAIKARPSRGNLKQVFSFLSGGRVDPPS